MTTRVTRALGDRSTASTTRRSCGTRSPSCRTSSSAAYLAGGTEKLRGGDDYGVPLVATTSSAPLPNGPELVVDLSDEPVLGPARPPALSRAARSHAALAYAGADFRFDPPALRAVSRSLPRRDRHRQASREDRGHGPRRAVLLASSAKVVVVAMGRGGPPEPEVVESPPTHRGSRLAVARRAAMPPPTTSRPPRLPACHGRLPALRRRDRRRGGDVERPRGGRGRARARSRPRRSSTGAAPAFRRSPPDARILVAHDVGGGIEPVPRPDLRSRPDDERAASARESRASADVPVLSFDLRLRPVAARRTPRRRLHDRRRAPSDHLDARRRARLGATSPTAHALRDELARRRRRRLPRRAQGRRDRRRRRGCARARRRGRLRRQRGRRRRAGRARSTTLCRSDAGARRMSEPRHLEPLPLGDAGLPYSKGLMARALIAVGVSAAARVRARAARRAATSTRASGRRRPRAARGAGRRDPRRGGGRARRCAGCAATASCSELDLPIILLVGGATGTGKSTVATEVAYRLGITRVTSTDFIRQTMRAFFSQRVHAVDPLLELRGGPRGRRDGRTGDAVVPASSSRRATCSSACAAAIERALEEGWSMVLEGVHLVPGDAARAIEGALVVQCVLAIEDEEAHAHALLVRDVASDGVRADRQVPRPASTTSAGSRSYIVRRAERDGVPVIENDEHRARRSLRSMELVLASAEQAARARMTDRRRARAAARGRAAADARPVPLRELRARDRARGAGRRALARPGRPGGGGGGGLLGMRAALDELPISGRVVIGAPRGATRLAVGDDIGAGGDDGRPRARPARGPRRRRARRQRRDVDDRGRRARLAAGAARHVHAQDGRRPARARPIDLAAARSRDNVRAIADAFGRSVNDITTIVLDRPRHHDLIEEIRARRRADQADPGRRRDRVDLRRDPRHERPSRDRHRRHAPGRARRPPRCAASAASCRRSSGRRSRSEIDDARASTASRTSTRVFTIDDLASAR